jgi:hypothetical protein
MDANAELCAGCLRPLVKGQITYLVGAARTRWHYDCARQAGLMPQQKLDQAVESPAPVAARAAAVSGDFLEFCRGIVRRRRF